MTAARLESLPVRQRRALALALLGLAIAVLVLLFIWPAAAMVLGHRQWREDAAETLGRYQALASSRTELQAQLALADSHAVWGTLFPATDTAAATNAVRAEFQRLLDALKVPVQVSTPLDPIVGTRLVQVGIRLDVQLTIDQLQSLLERVQANPHRLVLDNVTITAPQFQSPENNPTLQMQMEVRGFMRRPAGSEAS